MSNQRALLGFAFWSVAWLACAPLAHTAEFQVRGYTIRVPDGFTVELACDTSLVKYPVCANFDERGRLYVCEASGTAQWNKPQPIETRHRVVRLEDSNGDGVFDRRTTFAEFEMMPQGSCWLDGSLYVAAAPVIWKLTDADDDGVAERCEEWVKTDAVTGCLNDLRGPYLGPDGNVYWCKGPATQTYSRDGKPWTSAARHILRRPPNGKDVDVLMVGGMDNPVEIAFAANGERFVTCTNFQMLGTPRDDGILHAVYGAVHPKDIGPVFEYPWTGPDLMPPLTGWGAMSPAGLMCNESSVLGREYQGNLFSALFSGHKVMRHALAPSGSTYASRDEDFLVCDDVAFHPTDVLEDADGSLLVIETGGWYLHCCPSSTFYRPDVSGAIYRVRKSNAAKVADPRGATVAFANLAPDALATMLGDARPAVRRQATEQLAGRGVDALPALQATLKDSPSVEARCAAVWTTTRIAGPEARALVREALADRDVTVRQAALNSISLHRDPAASPTLTKMLASGTPHERRLAAETLGRLHDRAAVPALLAGLSTPADRFLEHALIYALIDIADADATSQGLTSRNVAVRRGALIALDQMHAKTLDPQRVIAELDTADERMQDASWWIVSRHAKEWGGLLAERLRKSLANTSASADERAVLKKRLAKLARAPGLSSWLVTELTAAQVAPETRMLLLEAMSDAGGQFAEPQWVEALLTMLQQPADRQLSTQLIATLAKMPPVATRDDAGRKLYKALNAGLLASARDAQLAPEARVRALAGIRDKSLGAIDDELFGFLLLNLAPDQPLALRTSAAEALARSKLNANQLSRLAGGLKNLALSELNVVLPLFQGQADDALGRRLVSSLQGSSSADGLNAFRLRTVLGTFSEPVLKEAQPLFDRLEQAQAEQLAKATRVLTLLQSADPHRGIQVFLSQKAACASCHKAAHVGGVTGPHLQGVGKRRTERDLIESILFPSASLVQSYESWVVATTDGRMLNGVLLEDRPDEILLSAGVDKTYRIPRAAVEQMQRSELSIMPTGLDKTLSEQELADLVAYLKSL
ncbi:MAG: HEAT repeat domain-containing protein [Planctomycetes bacterium]|nr:HEAT repeat domain-containing protein [Planctomycetota bacterium]